jgi:ABC-type lipoprotein export system ATPase subunit
MTENYLETIRKKYDIKDHVETPVTIPDLPTEGIVLIVGTSGSGKSTNLKSRLGSYLNKDGTTRKMPGYGGTTTARDAGRLCYSHEYIGHKKA